MLRNIVGIDNGIKQKITELVSMMSRGNNPPTPIILIDGEMDTGKTFMANELAEELSHIKQNGEYVVDIEYIDCSIPNSIGKFDNLFYDRAYWNYKNRVFVMDNVEYANIIPIKNFFKSSMRSLNNNNIFFIVATSDDDDVMDFFYDITYLNIHLYLPSSEQVQKYLYYLDGITNNIMDFNLDISILGSCKSGFDKSIDPKFEMTSKLLCGFGWSKINGIIYKASIEAQNDSRDYITYRDLCEGFMTSVGRPKGYMKDEDGGYILDKNLIQHIAHHEAGHAVSAYMLTRESKMDPEPIVEIPVLCTIRADGNGNSFVYRYSNIKSIRNLISEINILFAGKIAAENYLNGNTDIGAESDIKKAYASIKTLIMEDGHGGINRIDPDHIDNPGETRMKEISALFTMIYEGAEKMVAKFQHIIDEVAKELIGGRDLLTYYDLEEIIEDTIKGKR